MPKMMPLQEWICDTCHQRVSIKEGWLEWIADTTTGARDFRITHHKTECQRAHGDDVADMYLVDFLGPDGLQNLLSMLDAGPVLHPDGSKLPQPPERRSFVDVIRGSG